MSYRIEAMNGKWMLIPDGQEKAFAVGDEKHNAPDGTLKLFLDDLTDPIEAAVTVIEKDTNVESARLENRRHGEQLGLEASRALEVACIAIPTVTLGSVILINHLQTEVNAASKTMDIVSVASIAVISLIGILSHRRKKRSTEEKTNELNEIEQIHTANNQQQIDYLRSIALGLEYK